MCSIFGRYAPDDTPRHLPAYVIANAQARGRDTWGIATGEGNTIRHLAPHVPDDPYTYRRWIIGNARAEPTTEWVQHKTVRDVQPFTAGPLTVSHNGTIANDRDLMARYGLDLATTSAVDTARWAATAHAAGVDSPDDVLAHLDATIGSYAIAVGHADGWLVLACNYRPIWTRTLPDGTLEWSSVAPRHWPYLDRLADGWTMLDPYSALILRPGRRRPEHRSLRRPGPGRTLAVCSGGMDSTVAAVMAMREGPTDLLHITYGCRAQEREHEAVTAIADHLGAGLRTLDLTDVFAAVGNSRLTGTWAGAATGETGAEYAVEWVPARNTILLAVATGIAEGNGYDRLILGNNIEEAGAYPDNEQEFIGRFNDLLPFAVADGRQVVIHEPVGTYTKREIVRAGLDLGAPLHLTWSCYNNGPLHCGTCGPCYMRQVAFQMCGAADPIDYHAEAAVV